jgi:peptidoglycan/LPS O-acetylase OafA/YrhL
LTFSFSESCLRLTFQSNLARSDKYRPDIDGLRAIAVLPVVFFHAKVAGFSGGFVGVDIFYVISGYLITSLIAKDIALGRFSIISFYERRIRRIFPALFAVMFASTLVACILFYPQDFIAFGKSMIATTLFVSNVFFKHAAGTGGYFGLTSESQVLLHTWSLSVEEQFYLLLPTALLLLARWTNGRVLSALSAVAIVSFLISVWTTQHRPLTAFYIFVPRAWELLIGSLLAMKAVPPLNQRVSREIAGFVGLGLIAWAIFIFAYDTTFPGLAALVPCLGA